MANLFWQIFKYGVIGILATAINLAVAELFAAFLGFASSSVSDAERATRAVHCNFVGFFVANLVCWLLNRRYVFTPGRHHWIVEYALFLASSGFAILCGSAAIWTLVRFYGMQTTYSFVTNVLVSVIVNFVFRKFFIFKG